MNIKVAVRLRPFNKRELKMKSKLCVNMKDKTIQVIKDNNKIVKKFTFDYCFWSHDEFIKEKNGYLKPNSKQSRYADQQKVYQSLGKDLLDNFVKGFNCCLLAYGQTGSGKSYSIFGYNNNKGIVPILCEDLFTGNTQKMFQSKEIETTFKISMIEIYNEKVYDLLIPIEQRSTSSLKLRENKKLGVYVEGQKSLEVKSFEEVKKIIDKGNENKSIGSTLMNTTSSRSHTIILMNLKQIKNSKNKKIQKISQFYLVDLAGSEKIQKGKAKKERLQEACSINKSLTVLGQVINQLFKKNSGKKKKILISYRNSILTRLLKNALGGNSKTSMICAISPSRDNYDETISTLRYADQAKQIKQKAIINESPVEKLIRELTKENQRLIKMLSSINLDDYEKLDIKDQIQAVDQELKIEQKDLKGLKNKTIIKQNEIKRQSQIKEIMGIKKIPITKTNSPLIINLNEDPLLSEKIMYSFENQSIIEIGRYKQNNKGLRIVLNSVGILNDHAQIIQKNDNLYIIAHEPDAAFNCFINGQCLEDFEIEDSNDIYFECKLNDMDRLIFGTCTTFLVRIPIKGKIKKNVKVSGQIVDWEYCQLEKFELQENQERLKYLKILEQKRKEIQQREQQLIEQFEQEKQKYEEKIKKQQQQYEDNLKQLRQQLNLKLIKINKNQNKNQDSQIQKQSKQNLQNLKDQLKNHQQQFENQLSKLTNQNNFIDSINSIEKALKEKLIHFYPKLKEANTISEDLNRRIQFLPYVTKMQLYSQKNNNKNNLLFQIKVFNQEDGFIYFWSLDKFEQRLEIMKDIYIKFQNKEKINFNDIDPFYDEKEDFLYAKMICSQQKILKKISKDYSIDIMGLTSQLGKINISIIALDSNHQIVKEDKIQQIVNTAQDLIQFEMSCNFQIVINNIQFNDISEIQGKDAYIKFQIKSDNGIETLQTSIFSIKENNIIVNQKFTINLVKVNKTILDYYQKEKLVLSLFIIDLEKVQQLGKLPLPIVHENILHNEELLEQNQKIHQQLVAQMNKNTNRSSFQRRTIFEQTQFNKRPSKNLCHIFQLIFLHNNVKKVYIKYFVQLMVFNRRIYCIYDTKKIIFFYDQKIL